MGLRTIRFPSPYYNSAKPMVIHKRETFITPSVPKWTHKIITKYFTCHLRVSAGNRVVAAEAQIHWTLGQRLDRVREVSNSRGHKLEKL